jgi:hypothetical protein
MRDSAPSAQARCRQDISVLRIRISCAEGVDAVIGFVETYGLPETDVADRTRDRSGKTHRAPRRHARRDGSDGAREKTEGRFVDEPAHTNMTVNIQH